MKLKHRSSSRSRQRGAALVVSLILLMVITLLAISGMNTATVELQMAGNMQYAQNAFQAAETGIERTMNAITFNTNAMPTLPRQAIDTAAPKEEFESITRFQITNGMTAVPDGGYSMAVGSGFSAYHFDITSTGTSARNARAVNTQSFYIVGPNGG